MDVLSFLSEGSLCTESAPWACFLLKEEWGDLFLPYSALHDRPCIVIMRVFSESLPRSAHSPFCSVTAHGPRTVEIWPAGVLFLASPLHRSWGRGPCTGASTAAVSSSLRMQTENQCLCLEWRGHEGGRSYSCLSASWSTQLCSLQFAVQQFIKCDTLVCAHTAVSLLYSMIKTTSARPYPLMFGPGRELYCPELLSSSLFIEADFLSLLPAPAEGLLPGEGGLGRNLWWIDLKLFLSLRDLS